VLLKMTVAYTTHTAGILVPRILLRGRSRTKSEPREWVARAQKPSAKDFRRKA
jgi:hypothetical protein